MSEGKWISDLRPEMPVVEAARQVLAARLKPVRDRLPKAVRHADENPEYVHQLRVSTRRAAAALRIFAESLPPKAFKKARKALRKVRRAAGEARDWDVFLETVHPRAARAVAAERAGLDFLVGAAHGQRLAAQQMLEAASADKALDLDAILHKTVGALEKPTQVPGNYSLRDLAAPLFKEELQRLEEASQRDLHDYKQLHQVRIQGKRLRYAMEVFACCFEKAFRDELYPAVEKMQEILGQANDSHVALEHLEVMRARLRVTSPALWKRYQRGIEAMITYHGRLLPQKRKQFEAWLRNWRKSGAMEAFTRLLKNA